MPKAPLLESSPSKIVGGRPQGHLSNIVVELRCGEGEVVEPIEQQAAKDRPLPANRALAELVDEIDCGRDTNLARKHWGQIGANQPNEVEKARWQWWMLVVAPLPFLPPDDPLDSV